MRRPLTTTTAGSAAAATRNNSDSVRSSATTPTGGKRWGGKGASRYPKPSSSWLVVILLLIIMMAWVGSLVSFYGSLPLKKDTGGPTGGSGVVPWQDGAAIHGATTTTHIQNSNPYEGWQPVDREDTDPQACSSWRTCFVQNHKCPGRCRDGKLEEEDNERGNGQVVVPVTVPDSGSGSGLTTWIPDVEMLHRMLVVGHDHHGRPWPPPLVTPDNTELCEPIGVFGGSNDENGVLLKAVPIQAQPLLLSRTSQRQQQQQQQQQQWLPRILCMVYTMESEHTTRIRAIRETWAPGCDGFLAFSTVSDPRIPAISLFHEGPEAYNNMWQKVRSIWAFVGQHYLDQFDFFFQGGDDLYVMPQNLRLYLAKAVENPDQEDFFGGRRFKSGAKDYFNSGGAGYVLSRATLRKFATKGLNATTATNSAACATHTQTSMEDVMIARCLRQLFGIGLVDTRDELGRERFHPFSPGDHYSWRPPIAPKKDWYEAYNREWGILLGRDCCAPDSVSFHYIKKPAMMRHLHSLLYFCDNYTKIGR